MHRGKFNSTQLNCSVQLSLPLCIEAATTGDGRRRRFVDGRRRFVTVKNVRRPSQLPPVQCTAENCTLLGGLPLRVFSVGGY